MKNLTTTAKIATATTAKALYEVRIFIEKNFVGEFTGHQMATSIKGAQALMVAAITREGYAMTDYEVANWNGTSVTSISNALNNMGDYSCDVDGKGTRVMVFINKMEATTKGAEKAAECAAVLASGGRFEYKQTRIYTTTAATADQTTSNISNIAPESIKPASAVVYVDPASYYGKYNGQRLEVKQVLCNGALALVLPNYGGNTADFLASEVRDVYLGTEQPTAPVAVTEDVVELALAPVLSGSPMIDGSGRMVGFSLGLGLGRIMPVVLAKPTLQECQTIRTMLVSSYSLNLTSGARSNHQEAWETVACATPLFTEAEMMAGECAACARGWATPTNYRAGTEPPTE